MNAARAGAAMLAAVFALLSGVAWSSPDDDRAKVAAIDTEYQAAVKRNDAAAMDRIFDPGFILVLGTGAVHTREELLESARSGKIVYEHQEEEPGTQTVRVWGDTAVVTALLRLKGTNEGKPFDRRLWFSDTYVRTAGGWRYAFGQASIALPAETRAGGT